MNSFMLSAIEEGRRGFKAGDGGPFGAVIVRDGIILAQGHNEVLKTQDPTAHAEVVAIRRATALLGRFDLFDCQIYASCEPCPMCFAAIHWARIKSLYYAGTQDDAAAAGFDDRYIYEVIRGRADHVEVTSTQIDHDAALTLFDEWNRWDRKTLY